MSDAADSSPEPPDSLDSTYVSLYVEGSTIPVNLCFKCEADCASVEVAWLNYEGRKQKYATLVPGASYAQSSYSNHVWCLSYSDGNEARYVGDSALVVALPGGQVRVEPYQDPEQDTSWRDPAWGDYKQRGSILGMSIMAYECVCEEAVRQVGLVVTNMLAGSPPQLVERLVAAGCNVAIIGRHQVTTDIPPHHFMKFRCDCEGGRDIDATTRGLGATPVVPTTSCGEENLTMVDDRRYPHENILIHEFGHAVMTLGFTEEQQQRIVDCYNDAKRQKLYDPDCYMMDNEDEYWAEGCQSWFDATIRTDVNSGINTRDKVKQHDPQLAALLEEVLGDGPWRYPHTAPGKLRPKGKTSTEQQQQQTQTMVTTEGGSKHAAGEPPEEDVQQQQQQAKRQRMERGTAAVAAAATAAADHSNFSSSTTAAGVSDSAGTAAAAATPQVIKRVTFKDDASSSPFSPKAAPHQPAGDDGVQVAAPGPALAEQRAAAHLRRGHKGSHHGRSRLCSAKEHQEDPAARDVGDSRVDQDLVAMADEGLMKQLHWLGAGSRSSWLMSLLLPCMGCCAFGLTASSRTPTASAVAVVPRSMLLAAVGPPSGTMKDS